MLGDEGLVRKIVSSGQTGVELAALDVAVKLGLSHGGWAPRGLRNDDGPIPVQYGIVEAKQVGFHRAMSQNIMDSDGTLLITRGQKTPETRYAVETALKHQRQLLHVDLSQHSDFESASLTSSWISLQKVRDVFVTGPSARQEPQIYPRVKKILETALYLGFVKTGMHPQVGPPGPLARSSVIDDLPQTVQEAVRHLKNALPLKDRTTMANMQSREVELLRSGLGEYVKQNFGLYAGNPSLMASCMQTGTLNHPLPDEASAVILRALWEDLQSTHKLRVIK